MANTCTTSYALTGDEKSLKEIQGILEEMKNDSPDKFNWGRMAFENFFNRLCGTHKNKDARGEFLPDTIKLEDGVLRFSTESSWSRSQDIENEIRKKYPDVEVHFLEEELGWDIFQTNDEQGRFFDETVIIDTDDEMEYYTPDKALTRLNEMFKRTFGDIEEAAAFAALHNRKAENERSHVWIHVAEFINS